MPGHVGGDIVDDVVGHRKRPAATDRRDDAPPRVVVGGLDAGVHSTPEPRKQIGAEFRQRVEFPIAADHELTSLPLEGINRLLEFLDRGPLADKKLKIVNHQEIG